MILGLRMGRAIVAFGVLAWGGCKAEPGGSMSLLDHCSDLQGDSTCAVTYTGRPYCSLCVAENQGCVVTRPALVCQLDPGTTSSDDESTSEESGSSTGETLGVDTTAADSTTGEPPCEQEGELDPGCMELDPTRPFCIDAACMGCEAAGGDEFCRDRNLASPACDAVAGGCVGCGDVDHAVCGDATPVCAPAGDCLACTEHEQCPGTACHLADDDPLLGHCFQPEEVLWVDNAAACPGVGTEREPLCSLVVAAAMVQPGEAAVLRVRGGIPYAERAVFSGELSVAIIGEGNPVISGHPGQQAATLIFEDGVTGYVQGVRVDGNALTHGIMCNFSTLVLEDGTVRGNDGWGVFDFEPCMLDVRRMAIAGNEDGGLRVSGGRLRMDNTAVMVNGVGGSSTGIRLIDAEAHIVYSTIAGNDGSGADGIECSGATGSLRNSIVVGVDAFSTALDCFPLIMEHNALDSANFAGGTNESVGVYNPIYFENPAEGNASLTAPPLTPYGDVALWVEGDPVADFEGTPRPMGGNPGYAGADEP